MNHYSKNTKCYFMIDMGASCSNNRLYLQKMDNIDFLFLSPHINLGGSEASGILLGKKSACDFKENQIFEDDISNREIAGVQNIYGFYRAALSLELQDKIGLKNIQKCESENVKYIFDEVGKVNQVLSKMNPPRKILICGDYNLKNRRSIIAFNIQGPGGVVDKEGRLFFDQNYITRVLSDLFGIQTYAGDLQNLTYYKTNFLTSLYSTSESQKANYVRMDAFFTFEKYELDYILNAITNLAIYGENLMPMYKQDKKSGKFKHIATKKGLAEFSLKNMLEGQTGEFSYLDRKQMFQFQMEQGMIILKTGKIPSDKQNQAQMQQIKIERRFSKLNENDIEQNIYQISPAQKVKGLQKPIKKDISSSVDKLPKVDDGVNFNNRERRLTVVNNSKIRYKQMKELETQAEQEQLKRVNKTANTTDYYPNTTKCNGSKIKIQEDQQSQSMFLRKPQQRQK